MEPDRMAKAALSGVLSYLIQDTDGGYNGLGYAIAVILRMRGLVVVLGDQLTD
jgi:hypothetical protein